MLYFHALAKAFDLKHTCLNHRPLPETTIAGTLKQTTAVEHQHAESLLLPRLKALHSLDDYAHLLSMFYGFFVPVQQSIISYITPDELPDIHLRRHAGYILSDLKNFGRHDVPPMCTQLPSINNIASAFGALYVLEGSTLGGRMIGKMLRQNTALHLHDNQLQFFNGYGEQTGPMWVRFLAALNQQTDAETLIASAQQTFTLFAHWIEQTLYARPDQKK